MGIIVKDEIDYIYEAVLYLTLEYNEGLGPFYQKPEALMSHLLNGYDVPEEVLKRLFANTQVLYDKLRLITNSMEDEIRKYFTTDLPHGISFGRLAFIFAHGDEQSVDEMIDSFLLMDSETKHDVLSQRVRLIFEPTSDSSETKMTKVDFYDYLDDVDAPDAVKWKALDFYRHFDDYLVGAGEILKKVILCLKEEYELIESMVSKGMMGIKELLSSSNRDERFKAHYSIALDFEKTIIIHPQVVTSNGVSLVSENDEVIYLYVASLYDAITDMTETYAFNVERVAGDLKVLGDKRKFEILCKLREKPMYGQEIAESIGLTTATVSHHMSQLIERQMVMIEKKDHRIYYELHTEQFEKMLGHIRKLFVDY